MIHTIPSLTYGCDPELFFERGGRVIGAEKVIPEEGLESGRWGNLGPLQVGTNLKAFVLDGVQVELNPTPNTCRANLGNEIAAAMRTIKTHLAGMEGIEVSFRAVVKVDKEELRSLSEKSRTLGCMPSFNMYDSEASIKVNPKTFRTRSAGGHIHLGFNGYAAMMQERERLIPILDILLGNTCVLIDRDPLAAERRKVYGRAGEYRLPDHGIEYRTLSNFWLKAYPLLSMVMGISRLATSVLYTSTRGNKQAENDLLSLVNPAEIAEAINTNNVELAKRNWDTVRGWIAREWRQMYGVYAGNVQAFDHFIKRIDEKGLEYWFPESPMDHWLAYTEGHFTGFESGLMPRVAKDMLLEKQTEVPHA